MKKSFKNYDLLEVVGKGGMAVLYKGFQRSLDRNVAIKELHAFLIDNKSFIERFEREAKALASLTHENIVQVYDFGEENESYYIVMEFVDGFTLKELMQKSKKFPIEIALMVTYQMCAGLEHAHSSGITHRDMKPGNVLLNKFGVVKIADFGLAQAANLDSITVTGSLIGTPAYMSPEQAAGKKVDHRTDIFSTGVMLYELLSGAKPYDGDSYSSVIAKILTQKPREITEVEPNLPTPIVNIINKALAKDVEKRYSDIGEMMQDMETYFASLQITPNKRLVKNFIANPSQYQEKHKEKFVNEHLNKGIYYMQMGLEKFDDATTEFNHVLSIDPSNPKAKQYLKEMKKQKEESGIFEPEEKPGPAPIGQSQEGIADAQTGFQPITPEPSTVSQPISETPTVTTTGPYRPIAQPKKKSKAPLIVTFVIIGIISILAFLQFGTDYKLIVKSEAPTTTFHLEFKPDDATVYLDNKVIGNKSPIDLKKVEVGPHVLKLSRDGYEDYEVKVDFIKDQPFKKTYKLEEIPPDKPQLASVKVTSDPPNAKVKLDGVSEITTPGKFENVKPGEHILMISYKHESGIEVKTEKSFNAKSGDILDYQINLQDDLKKLLKTSVLMMSKPSGVQIYQDGKDLKKKTPIELSPFAPGNYTFKFSRNGYVSKEVKFEVKPGIQNKINVTLQKIPAEPTPDPTPDPPPERPPDPTPDPTPTPPQVAKDAYLKIKVVPWAKIYIDGEYVDTTPIPKPVKVKAGNHTIKAVNPQFEEWEETINFPGGETISKNITLKKKTASKGFLKVSVNPWAKLYIDGEYFDTTPIAKPIELDEGSHTIKLENPACKVHEETITITAGQTVDKAIQLVYK